MWCGQWFPQVVRFVNESQSETSIYKFQIDISDEDRLNINRVLFTLSFICNISNTYIHKNN